MMMIVASAIELRDLEAVQNVEEYGPVRDEEKKLWKRSVRVDDDVVVVVDEVADIVVVVVDSGVG